jgi:hypothetical protein
MKKNNDILSTFYSEQYLTKYSFHKNKSNSFISNLRNPDIFEFNNTMLKLKNKYSILKNLKINLPQKSPKEKQAINSNSTPSLLINNFHEINVSPKKREMNENVDKIVNMLISNKLDKTSFLTPVENTELEIKEKDIDPKFMIKRNFKFEPNNKNLFKSYGSQIKALGNEKYRRALFRGVNDYEIQTVKYSSLKGPTGYDANENKKKKNKTNSEIKKLIWDMEKNSFNDQLNNNNIGRNKCFPVINKYNSNGKKKVSTPVTVDEKLIRSMENAQNTLIHFNNRGKEYQKMKEDIYKFLYGKKKENYNFFKK